MAAIINKNEFVTNSGRAIVDHNLKSYEQDPYFVKKAEKAAAFLKNSGLPKLKKK